MPRTYNKGNNQNTYALYEELLHLRVAPDAEVVSIYKRLDTQQSLSLLRSGHIKCGPSAQHERRSEIAENC